MVRIISVLSSDQSILIGSKLELLEAPFQLLIDLHEQNKNEAMVH